MKRWNRCVETKYLDGCAFCADGRPTDQQVYLVPRTPVLSSSDVLVDSVVREKILGERVEDVDERILAPGPEGMGVTATAADWPEVMRWDGYEV